MSIDFCMLSKSSRILFSIPLQPLQGHRFQPTNFPSLGAATFQTPQGLCLLVESAQSMANRLEMTCWDDATQSLIPEVQGISHVTVYRKGRFFTDTVLESHRINSPYILEGKSKVFFNEFKSALGGLEEGPVDRRKLAEVLLNYDIGSLLHGVFLSKKELAGGRLRFARAISAFVEADGAQVAASGGVKNDHVNPSGNTNTGFGNVPFARDEYTAEKLTLYVNIDLSQIRGYGLGEKVERLLTTMALFKLRKLLSSSLRFRTACDLTVAVDGVEGSILPSRGVFVLPSLEALSQAIKGEILACQHLMKSHKTNFEDDLAKGDKNEKASKKKSLTEDAEDEDSGDDS